MFKKMVKPLLYFTNVVLYLVVLGLWISIPDETTLNFSVTAFSLGLSAALIFWNRKTFKNFYTSSYFKGVSDFFFSTVIIFCILGLVNYLAFKNPRQLDFSKDGLNTLTDQSIKIVKGLSDQLTVKLFGRKNELAALRPLIELYRYENNNILIKEIDVELRPDLVKRHEIGASGTILIEYNGRSHKTLARTELGITNAILKVSRKTDPVIYYSIGHQELDLKRKDNDGISFISKLVKNSLYDLKTINLAVVSKIPKDAKTLMIWGPKSRFHKSELSIIDKFIEDGGNLMIALDPDFTKDKIPGLRKLFMKWGMKISNDLVVDSLNNYSGSNGSIPLIKKFDKKHAITKGFKGPIFFPVVSSIFPFEGSALKKGFETYFQSIFKTTHFPASWAEKNRKAVLKGKVTYIEGQDIKGPIPVAGVLNINKKGRKSTILAFGNSTFVLNGYGNFGQNYLLFLNGLYFSTKQKNLISFNLPTIKDEPVFIGKPQLGAIFYFSVILAPLLLFAMAIYFYRRRLAL